MAAKIVFVFCAQAILAHVTLSQCVYPGGEYLRAFVAQPVAPACGCGGLGIGAGFGNSFAGAGLSLPNIEVIPTSGGALPVSSYSSIAPTGISVASENAYEGTLLIAGELPLLGTVALEGAMPSAGAGVVSYGCGNGVTAISDYAGNAAGVVGLGAAGIGANTIGYGAGIGGISPGAGLGLARSCGCGCGAY